MATTRSPIAASSFTSRKPTLPSPQTTTCPPSGTRRTSSAPPSFARMRYWVKMAVNPAMSAAPASFSTLRNTFAHCGLSSPCSSAPVATMLTVW